MLACRFRPSAHSSAFWPHFSVQGAGGSGQARVRGRRCGRAGGGRRVSRGALRLPARRFVRRNPCRGCRPPPRVPFPALARRPHRAAEAAGPAFALHGAEGGQHGLAGLARDGGLLLGGIGRLRQPPHEAEAQHVGVNVRLGGGAEGCVRPSVGIEPGGRGPQRVRTVSASGSSPTASWRLASAALS